MSLLAELLAIVTPPACVACGAAVERAGPLTCAACARSMRWLGARVCRRCGLPSHRGRGCPAASAAFATAWAPLAYDDAARALAHALKFRGALPVAALMAAQISANAPGWAIGGSSAVVGVPPAPARRRRRGFDPAALIARGVAERLGLPLHSCLRRRGRAPRQMGARRAERRAGGRLEIVARRAPPEVVLLVDDVHTTGATLGACAHALREAGARRVHAVTYARAL